MLARLADFLEYQTIRLGLSLLAPFRLAALRPALRLHFNHTEKQAFDPIFALRARLKEDHTEIPMPDFGSGRRKTTLDTGSFAKPQTRVISEIFAKASARHAWGSLLYQLTQVKQAQTILELGTNLGVSGAYILQALKQSPHPNKCLVTLEGNPHLAERARHHLAGFAQGVHVEVVTGTFKDSLPDVLHKFGPFDLVFLDGHHERMATLHYFDQIAPYLRSGAWVIFDDLEPWSPTVRGAFQEIQGRYPQTQSADLVKFGILVWP